jgi:hypothetical protein
MLYSFRISLNVSMFFVNFSISPIQPPLRICRSQPANLSPTLTSRAGNNLFEFVLFCAACTCWFTYAVEC